jgi:hypothetical protein
LTIPNTPNEFQQVFISYREVKEANPDWSERMIEDYMSLKLDVLLTAEAGDSTTTIVNSTPSSLNAMIDDINERIGSGDALTWDETGFSWDSTNLTFDQTAA